MIRGDFILLNLVKKLLLILKDEKNYKP